MKSNHGDLEKSIAAWLGDKAEYEAKAGQYSYTRGLRESRVEAQKFLTKNRGGCTVGA